MTDLGPLTPAPASAGRAHEHDIPMWVIWTAVVLLVCGAGMVAFAFLAQQRAKADGPDYPASWDPRVLPYVQAAQDQRDLTFLHPVTVRFLSDAEFDKTVSADESKLTKEDRAEIERSTGLMRALGLIHGDVDLFSAFNDVHTSGTLAYYSFEDQRITVRGQQLALASHATLVHELTHALQDQHFGIGKRFRALAKEAKDEKAGTTQSDVLRALVEGDADRTEDLYRKALPVKQRKRLVAAEKANEKKAMAKVPDVPKVVLAYIGAPYALGRGMVDVVAQENGGSRGINALYGDTPAHDAALLDPFTLVTGRSRPAMPDRPDLAKGEKKFDAGEFGALTWYLMLGERLPLRDALAAVDGWHGDAYVAFERDGKSCARATYAGASTAGAQAMYTALVRWTQAVPGHRATSAIDGKRVSFETCDPGTKVGSGKGHATDALGFALSRTALSLEFAKLGMPAKAARCSGGRLLQEFSVAQLNDRGFLTSAANQARLRQVVTGCR